ncbi:MAG: S1C family serine protease, partial [Planctomycetaceae bacterium]|nr:S1C family serine protease [Planctomycetaceae bacterium]
VVAGIDTDSIQILTKDRYSLKAVGVSANEDFDIAVIETEGKIPPPVKFGNSDDLAAGDIILALGSPFGLERSLSLGIISAVGRRYIPGGGAATPRVSFLQVDAAVNPGSSGGPMLNLNGEVIGLQTAIATQSGGNEGVAFIMPVKTVLRVAEQLVKTGSVVRPYIGCGFDASFSMDDRRRLGIDRLIGSRLKTIEPNGPASQAELKTGDVIVSFNGTEIEEDSHIVLLVAEAEIGKPVPLKVNRNGQTLDITLTPETQLSR